MARFLQDRSCNDDFVPIPTTRIVDNSMDMDVEDETVEDNNIEEIIINIYANEEYIIQENKKRKREDEDDEDENEEDEEELDEDYELEEDNGEIDEDDDVYQYVALLEAENEDLRQQLANANNIVPSHIPFPDGYHIGFEYVNGVRYLFVYQQPQQQQPVNNRQLSLADLQDDDEDDEDDDEDDEDDEVLSIINPDDIIRGKEKANDDEEMDISK
jgi:hypothetical protein